VISQAERYPATNFDRIRGGLWLVLPTDWHSPTVSARFIEPMNRGSKRQNYLFEVLIDLRD
jgi:hypothetical protein